MSQHPFSNGTACVWPLQQGPQKVPGTCKPESGMAINPWMLPGQGAWPSECASAPLSSVLGDVLEPHES